MPMEISTERKYSFKYTDKDSSVPVINDCICELQAGLAQYYIMSAVKHMKLKEAVNGDDVEGIVSSFSDLDEYLWDSLKEALEISHKYIKKYFSDRSRFPPRITIKAPYGESQIVDLYRKDKSPFSEFLVDENSAFKYIKDTGMYYICNDIPLAVSEEKYKNKRINGQMVRNNYSQPGMIKKGYMKVIGQPEVDAAWESCWDTGSPDNRPHTESCYKSTLVVPMTLINASLRREFLNYMFDGEEILQKDDEYKKLMFGFLCVDHRHTGYFNHESDVRIGYIIADLLSLFLVTRVMCTTKSRTYQYAKEIQN